MLHFANDPGNPNKQALCNSFCLQRKLINGSSLPFAKDVVLGKKLFSNELVHSI